MIYTFTANAPVATAASIIAQGRNFYPTIGSRCKYISIQLGDAFQDVAITRNPTAPGNAGFFGRRLSPNSPVFELSDFQGGSVPTDWWIASAMGVQAVSAYVTIIDDVQ